MLTEPIVLADDGTNRSLPRTGTSPNASNYSLDAADLTHLLTVQHEGFSGDGSSRRKRGSAAQIPNKRIVLRYVRGWTANPTGASQLVEVAATLTVAWPTILTAADAAARGLTIASLASTSGLLLKIANGET